MKYKSRAISLTYIKHGESSIISKIFTKEKGLQTFIIKGVRSKKTKKKISYFEPLKLLNIDASYDAKKSIQYLEEVSLEYNLESSSKKMHKNFLGFFIAEVSSKVLQENEYNSLLFNFVWETSINLYRSEKIDPNFALKYLLNLSEFLGFRPSVNEMKNPLFNLTNGSFCDKKKVGEICLNEKKSRYLKNLLSNEITIIPRLEKSDLLKDLLNYYKLQNYDLDGITSHKIIESLIE